MTLVEVIERALRSASPSLASDTGGYGEEGWVDGAMGFDDSDFRDLAQDIAKAIEAAGLVK